MAVRAVGSARAPEINRSEEPVMVYSHQAPHMMTLHRRSTHTSALAMPRRRGATTGTLLVLLGIWGAIIPVVGPYFGYRMDTAGAWVFTWDRLWLSILPGAAAFIGGLILLGAADRLTATVGSWLALAGGVWFVVGPTVSLLWGSPIGTSGVGAGSETQRFIEQIGYFYGLGAVITALAAGAWTRAMVRSERDALLLENAAATDTVTDTETAPAAGYPVGEGAVVRDDRIGDHDRVLRPDGYDDRTGRDDPLVRGDRLGRDDRDEDRLSRDRLGRDGRGLGDERLGRDDRSGRDDAGDFGAMPTESARTEVYRDPTSSTGYRQRVVPDSAPGTSGGSIEDPGADGYRDERGT
jgi:hypothetical protein